MTPETTFAIANNGILVFWLLLIVAGFSSLHGVAAFFSSPYALTAGWVHYLVFDLFVGAWETRDAKRRGIPHLLVIPCLVVTLVVGPVGLLLYIVLRAVLGKGGFFLTETPA